MQQEREKAERLGLLRQQLRHQPGQVQCFGGEVAMRRVGAGRVAPAFGEGGVDRLEHGVETADEVLAPRYGESDARGTDLVLGTHEALAHRRWRSEEGA